MSRKEFLECPIVVTVMEGSPVRSYYCRFPEWSSCSWANFYIDSSMGTFIMSTDWLDLQHRWGRTGNASYDTFDEFIAFCSGTDYIMNKLSYGRRDELREFKYRESTNDLKDHIIKERLQRNLTRPVARILYQVASAANDLDDEREFYNHLYEHLR